MGKHINATKTAIFLLIFLTLETVNSQQIGGYKIPKDELREKACKGYDINAAQTKKVETKYDSFYLSKVTGLRKEFFAFLKSRKKVSCFSFSYFIFPEKKIIFRIENIFSLVLFQKKFVINFQK